MIERCQDFLTNTICKFRNRYTFGRDGLADHHLDRPATHMIRLGHQDRTRTANRNGNDRHLRFRREHETASLERLDAAVKTRPALRKEKNWTATLYRFRGIA